MATYIKIKQTNKHFILNTYSEELCTIGVQTTPDEGMNLSPKNKNPPSFCPLKQWPTTLRIRPWEWSWDKMLALPLPRPRTPAVEGGGVEPEYSRSYPHLACNRQKELLINYEDEHITNQSITIYKKHVIDGDLCHFPRLVSFFKSFYFLRKLFHLLYFFIVYVRKRVRVHGQSINRWEKYVPWLEHVSPFKLKHVPPVFLFPTKIVYLPVTHVSPLRLGHVSPPISFYFPSKLFRLLIFFTIYVMKKKTLSFWGSSASCSSKWKSL